MNIQKKYSDTTKNAAMKLSIFFILCIALEQLWQSLITFVFLVKKCSFKLFFKIFDNTADISYFYLTILDKEMKLILLKSSHL